MRSPVLAGGQSAVHTSLPLWQLIQQSPYPICADNLAVQVELSGNRNIVVIRRLATQVCGCVVAAWDGRVLLDEHVHTWGGNAWAK